jgi:hypothetical protein
MRSVKLRESPAFAATTILTLALGIGASTAIFAVLDVVLFDPLPFQRSDRLVAVASQPDMVVSITTMQDYQSRSTTFQSLAAYRQWSPSQKPTGGPKARLVLAVTQGFFSTLRARFALGTTWPITGDEQDCSAQVIISGGYWKQLGGGSSLGKRTLNLDGRDYDISGVLPAEQAIEGSYALDHPDVFVPVGCDTEERPKERGDASFKLIGRLQPDVTIKEAAADLERVDKTLRQDYPNDYGAYKATYRKAPSSIPTWSWSSARKRNLLF